ncbi:hypothetical protein EZS27_022722 [termite gut metagenome]|jgi:hypothetical protein|uniref:Uncharacterized protein n=1 Tax=termite gut metagenome TaxID=433724 RepID=A0A5J4R3S6_9ZZZZ
MKRNFCLKCSVWAIITGWLQMNGMECASIRAYIFYFTHPGRTTHEEAQNRTDGVLPYALRRSSIQVAPLRVENGILVCNRDEDFDFYLPDMK